MEINIDNIEGIYMTSFRQFPNLALNIAFPPNAGKIYASAGGEQPHIERNKDLQYFWADPCSIDKSKSNEVASLESKLKAELDAHMGTIKELPFSRKAVNPMFIRRVVIEDHCANKEVDMIEKAFPDDFHYKTARKELTQNSERTPQIQVNKHLADFAYDYNDTSTLLTANYAGRGRSGESKGGLNRAEFNQRTWESDFQRSRWFTRGWTLQELLIDTPGFEDTNKSDNKTLQWPAQSYITHELAVTMNFHINPIPKMGNLAILSSETGNPDDGQGRTALHYAPEKWHQSLVLLNSTAGHFGAQFRCVMSCDWATDRNYEESDLQNDRMSHFCCPDEDDMSSVSSNDQESLFDYSPSESDTITTVGSGTVQQELTYTNIEHMLAVLKAERGKCLRELRGFDAALETIDQLANRKCPGSEICLNRVSLNDVSLP
ncbi:hypothetical protein BGZ60DRAFT_143331 [Tricladium varicosporioides]|nr:hypothetical protein BGZ60DRAFT_143331 [Hymenoscyphus varicosporioides]